MPGGTVEMVGQLSLHNSCVCRKQISKLVGKSGKRPPHSVRRQLIQMHRHDSPRTLHHELQGEPTHHQKRVSWRKHPQRNQHNSKHAAQSNAPTTAPFLRKVTDNCSAADCPKSVNDPSRRLFCHTVMALFAEKGLI